MRTHIMSMTYAPKVKGIRNGTIRQTIRVLNPKRPIQQSDRLIIHSWSGKPYRSSWGWRVEGEVSEVAKFNALSDGVSDVHANFKFHKWDSPVMDRIAELDGIKPPTGIALKDVLEKFHGKFTDEAVRFQIIRW